MVFFDIKKYKKDLESNIGHHIATISWYISFMVIIPYLIMNLYSFNHLRFYFPVIDLIANSFAASGSADNIFRDLYVLSPHNLISFLSTNFINLIALVGVSWNGILHAFHYKSIWIGVMVTVFMYIITYLVPTQMIPYVIEKIQGKIDQYYPLHLQFGKITLHLEDYLAGIIIIIGLVLIEFIFVQLYITSLKSL